MKSLPGHSPKFSKMGLKMAQNAPFTTLKLKIFRGSMPPDPPRGFAPSALTDLPFFHDLQVGNTAPVPPQYLQSQYI